MAVLDGSHAAADADDPVGAALGKIIRAPPERSADPPPLCASTLRLTRPRGRTPGRRDHERPRRRPAPGAHRLQQRARQAVAAGICCVHSHRAGAVRAYRIDRIQSVTGGGERFGAPGDLDYVDLPQQHPGGSAGSSRPRSCWMLPRMRWPQHVRAPMGRLERIDGERCTLTGTTSNPAMYTGSGWPRSRSGSMSRAVSSFALLSRPCAYGQSSALGRSRAAHGSRRPDQIPPRAARLAIPGRATGALALRSPPRSRRCSPGRSSPPGRLNSSTRRWATS